MAYNLLEKLKTELDQFRSDLKAYTSELNRLVDTRNNAIGEANLELQRALDTFDKKIQDVTNCMNTMKEAISQYEYTVSFLEKMEGNENNV